MKVYTTLLTAILTLTFHAEIVRALPFVQSNNWKSIGRISEEAKVSRPFDDGDENVELVRRGVIGKLKKIGNSAADVFRTKAQKQANALREVTDSHKHVTPKTLSRLNTIDLAKHGTEFANQMNVKDAVKVGKVVSEKVNKHADIRDKALRNLGSDQYEKAHFNGASKSEKKKIVEDQFGHHQQIYAQRPETKKVIHNQIHQAQKKMDNLKPLYNTFTHRVSSGDAARFDKAHPDHTKEKVLRKGWDHVVNAGQRFNKVETAKMLHDQNRAHETMREKIRTDKNLNLHKLPSPFDNHPNRPTMSPGSSHHSSNAQHTTYGNSQNAHQLSSGNRESSEAVKYTSWRQNFREIDKPKTLSFEGHEQRWTKKGKPAPQYFLGKEYIHEVDAVKNHKSPLAKQPHMSEYVQPKEVHNSPNHQMQSPTHSVSQSQHSSKIPLSSPKSGHTSENALLGKHLDPGPSTSSRNKVHIHKPATPNHHNTEIHSSSSSPKSNSDSSGSRSKSQRQNRSALSIEMRQRHPEHFQ